MIRAISSALRVEPECSGSRSAIGQRFRRAFPLRNRSKLACVAKKSDIDWVVVTRSISEVSALPVHAGLITTIWEPNLCRPCLVRTVCVEPAFDLYRDPVGDDVTLGRVAVRTQVAATAVAAIPLRRIPSRRRRASYVVLHVYGVPIRVAVTCPKLVTVVIEAGCISVPA